MFYVNDNWEDSHFVFSQSAFLCKQGQLQDNVPALVHMLPVEH